MPGIGLGWSGRCSYGKTMWRKLFNKLRRPQTHPPFLCDDPEYAQFRVGEWSYGRPHVIAFGDTGLSIGRYCSIANEVTILLNAGHRTDWVSTYPFMAFWPEAVQFFGHPAKKGDVAIGHDVWIGHRVLIMSGVRIGNGAVIGAGSVVTRDVQAYRIVAGNPAREVRPRFPLDRIAALERIALWQWPREKVVSNLPLLLSGEVEDFIRQHDPMPPSGQVAGSCA